MKLVGDQVKTIKLYDKDKPLEQLKKIQAIKKKEYKSGNIPNNTQMWKCLCMKLRLTKVVIVPAGMTRSSIVDHSIREYTQSPCFVELCRVWCQRYWTPVKCIAKGTKWNILFRHTGVSHEVYLGIKDPSPDEVHYKNPNVCPRGYHSSSNAKHEEILEVWCTNKIHNSMHKSN